jgi:hypothetical protein
MAMLGTTHRLQSQSQAKRSASDAYIIFVFCLIGLLLALGATFLFPELGTILGPFTLS